MKASRAQCFQATDTTGSVLWVRQLTQVPVTLQTTFQLSAAPAFVTARSVGAFALAARSLIDAESKVYQRRVQQIISFPRLGLLTGFMPGPAREQTAAAALETICASDVAGEYLGLRLTRSRHERDRRDVRGSPPREGGTGSNGCRAGSCAYRRYLMGYRAFVRALRKRRAVCQRDGGSLIVRDSLPCPDCRSVAPGER